MPDMRGAGARAALLVGLFLTIAAPSAVGAAIIDSAVQILAPGSGRVLGSGLLVQGRDGCVIVTAAHVVAENPEAEWRTPTGGQTGEDRTATTQWAGEDNVPDFAILKLTSPPRACDAYPLTGDIAERLVPGAEALIVRTLPDGSKTSTKTSIKTVRSGSIELYTTDTVGEPGPGSSGAPVFVGGIPVALVSAGRRNEDSKITYAVRLDYAESVAGSALIRTPKPDSEAGVKTTQAGQYDYRFVGISTKDGIYYSIDGVNGRDVVGLVMAGEHLAPEYSNGEYNYYTAFKLAPELVTKAHPVKIQFGFRDGSVSRIFEFDAKAVLQKYIDNYDSKNLQWVSCWTNQQCRFTDTRLTSGIISRIEFGPSESKLNYQYDLIAQTRAENDVKTLLVDEAFILPHRQKTIYYRVIFKNGAKSPIHSYTSDQTCDTYQCIRYQIYQAQSADPGAPTIYYRRSDSGLSVQFPAPLSSWTWSYDVDGRGFLDAGVISKGVQFDLASGKTVAVRFRKGATTLGPFRYTIDHETMILAPIPKMNISVSCDFDWTDAVEYCWLGPAEGLLYVKSLGYAFEPKDPLNVLPVSLGKAAVLDPSWRRKNASCYRVANEPDCKTVYRDAGALFTIPSTVTDIYFQVRFKDGTQSEVLRMPHKPRN